MLFFPHFRAGGLRSDGPTRNANFPLENTILALFYSKQQFKQLSFYIFLKIKFFRDELGGTMASGVTGVCVISKNRSDPDP